ncbi:MAG: FAD synthetase family protein [Spirochaetia bacterium]
MIWQFGEAINIGGPCHLAIGAFDALHQGHQRLLQELEPSKSIVTLFDPLPAQVFQPDFAGAIFSFRQRCEGLWALGIAHILRIDFSQKFSKMLGSEFLFQLQSELSLERIVVGEDFCMGQGRTFCAPELRQWGQQQSIEVVIVPHCLGVQQDKVSATQIRSAIQGGDFLQAQAILGRPYALDLSEFPARECDGGIEVDLCESSQVFPPDGVYQAQLGQVILRGRMLKMPIFEKECIFKNKEK